MPAKVSSLDPSISLLHASHQSNAITVPRCCGSKHAKCTELLHQWWPFDIDAAKVNYKYGREVLLVDQQNVSNFV